MKTSQLLTPLHIPRPRRGRFVVGRFLLTLLVGLAATLGAQAATYTWTGVGFFGNKDYLWSNPNNWAELAAPQPGEQGVQLVFPNSNAPRQTTNDVLNLVVKSASFLGANYAIHGPGANGVTMNLRGDNGGAFAVAASATGCQFGPGTRLHLASDGTMAVASSATFTIHSRVSGTFGFTKSSPGTLALQGTVANTFTGPTFVRDGLLVLRNAGLCLPGALTIGDGSAAYSPTVTMVMADQIGDSSPVTVNGNGELLFADVNDTFGNLTLSGGLVDTANGTLHLNGNVLVQAPTNGRPSDVRGAIKLGNIGRFFTVESNAVLDLSAVISGGAFGNVPAGVHKNGPGMMILGGAGNTFGGSLFVGEGTVSIGSGAQLGAVTNSTGVASNATLVLGQVGFGPVVNGRKLSLAGGGRVRTAFDSEWNGPIELASGKAIIEVTQASATLSLGGALGGIGGFEKLGVGELALGGPVDNSYTGASRVLAGRLSLRKTGINTNQLAVTGPLTIGEPGTSTNSPKVVVERSEMIAASVAVLFTGSLLLSNATETVPGLVVNSGYVSMDTNSLLALDGALHSTNNILRDGLIQGRLKLDGASRAMRVENYPLTISAVISGDNGDALIKTGGGQVRLSGLNTFPGPTRVVEGSLHVATALALSTSTTVSNGATLVLPGGVNLLPDQSVYLRGTGASGFGGALRSIGTNSMAGKLTCLDVARIEVAGATGLFTIKNYMFATDGFIKSGEGVLSFKPDGAPDNPGIYGPLVVREGELWLDCAFNTQAETPIDHSLVIGGDTGSPTATVRVLNRRQLTDGGQVMVNRTGRLYFTGTHTNSFNELDGSGLVDISPGARVNLGGDVGETNEFSGTLQGGAANETNLRKLGFSHFTLSGPNNLLGTTEVYAGSVWVNSSQPAARYELTGSGVLGGTGFVGAVRIGTGTGLAPGAPHGKLRIANCTIVGPHTNSFELHGAGDAATGDQLETDFQPALAQSVLKLGFGPDFLPIVGRQFTLIRNNTASPVLWNFPNLPEGTEWRPIPTLRFRINYNAGDGNDVVLTALAPPAPVQLDRILFNPGLPTILTGTGLPGDTYDVEATSTVGDPMSWTKIGTATAQAPNGAMNFVDLDSPNYPHRFYRFVLR